jgi:hypothetical protein
MLICGFLEKMFMVYYAIVIQFDKRQNSSHQNLLSNCSTPELQRFPNSRLISVCNDAYLSPHDYSK